MTVALILNLAGLAVLLAFSAFFSGTEVALFSLSRIQIRRMRQKFPQRGQVVADLLDHPHRLLSTILLGNIIVNIGASILGFGIIRSLAVAHAELIAVPVMTAVLLLFGEITPKSVMIQNAEFFALHLAPPIRFIQKVTRALQRATELVSALVIRTVERLAYFASHKARTSSLTEAEYQTLLGVSERAGVLQREERVMVNKILALEEMLVREIMTPRVDIQFVEDNLPRDQLVAALRQYKHRRVPIFHENRDNILGVLYVKDYLVSPDHALTDFIETPQIVPDTMSVAKLLKIFRRLEHPVAIVVDEHGGTEGMVTLEDVLEEIVGEIEDEFDTSEIMVQSLGGNRFLINGKARLALVNERCGVQLAAEAVDTIAGWMMDHLDSLPREGETVTADGVRVRAGKVVRNRIREVLLEVEPV